MTRAFHPTRHHLVDPIEPEGDVLPGALERIAHALDPVERGGTIPPSVRHLPSEGHVVGLSLGGQV